MCFARWFLGVGLLWACLWPAAPAVAADSALPKPLDTTRVAPGIFFHAGHQAEENTANHGDIANIGFILGTRCVAVVDTGGSPWVGRRLLAAIRARTQKPVCYVIDTHMHPDHLMGNRAFARHTHGQFVANVRLPAALAARAPTYLARLSHELPGQKPNASWLVLPGIKVKTGKTRVLNLGDRKIVLRAWPTAHTDNDLTVYDQKTRTLCAGDLLFIKRVPSIDGSLSGWLKALDRLRQRKNIARVVPGHGPVKNHWRRALATERAYLIALRQGIDRALAQGKTLQYATDHVGRRQRSKWLLFDQYNARNVTVAFTQAEWQ